MVIIKSALKMRILLYILLGVSLYNCNKNIKGGHGVLLPYDHNQNVYKRDTRLEGVWEQYGIFENFKVMDTVANKERLGRRFFSNSFADVFWDDNDTYDNNSGGGAFDIQEISSSLRVVDYLYHPIFDSMIKHRLIYSIIIKPFYLLVLFELTLL